MQILLSFCKICMLGCKKGVKATKTIEIVFTLVSIAHQTGKQSHIYDPSVAGFELVLARKMTFYVITYYLPSGRYICDIRDHLLSPPLDMYICDICDHLQSSLR